MKAVVYESAKKMVIKEVPIPRPQKNQVLLKIKACGICGTDIHLLSGVYEGKMPLIPGHEASGEVIELGSEVKFIKIGDRVAVDPNVGCGYCEFCQRGRAHLCKYQQPFGVFRAGAFAEYAVIEETHAYKIPDTMTYEQGSMVEPVACCLRGAQLSRYKVGDSVFIHGAGAIGNMNMQIARVSGATKITISDPLAKRRELALKLGADYAIDPTAPSFDKDYRKIYPDGADVVMECAGRTALTGKSVLMAKRGGIVVAFGCAPIGEFTQISPEYINSNEITICGSYNNPYTNGPAIDLISSGRINVDALITHKFGIVDFQKGLDTFGTSDALKVVIVP